MPRSEAAAARFVLEWDRAMGRVISTPETGARSLHGTRLHRIRRFPYVVIFREIGTTLQVVAIAHAKRRPGYWKRRLA